MNRSLQHLPDRIDRSTEPGDGRFESFRLLARQVQKPWGRDEIPPFLGDARGKRIGEIWFEHPARDDLPLLVKYILTSEKLSVQVHPSDEEAQDRGHQRGKTECWYVVHAEQGARLGLGLRSPLSPAALRAAALDGSIEHHLDWLPVASHDFFFVPAGTVHAIGAGITLLEIQQNSDVTYRLYDYGRPRELHLADGIAVASSKSGDQAHYRRAEAEKNVVLLDNPIFSVARVSQADQVPQSFLTRRRWVMPLQGEAFADLAAASAGECLLVEPGAPLELSGDGLALVAALGPVG